MVDFGRVCPISPLGLHVLMYTDVRIELRQHLRVLIGRRRDSSSEFEQSIETVKRAEFSIINAHPCGWDHLLSRPLPFTAPTVRTLHYVVPHWLRRPR
jgi:hypothetical protein